MYERILLPTDGSDGSERAVEHALALAEACEATLSVLSVVDGDEFSALEGVDLDDVREQRAAAVEEVAERARSAGVDADTAVREGVPHEAILEYADEVGADMIVMGTHGRSGVDRVLVGSVTERVVRQATVPVVTVRMTGDAARVGTEAKARERALQALETAGHDDIEVLDDPHRTSNSWIVPTGTSEGTFHVHVAASDGDTRIARLD